MTDKISVREFQPWSSIVCPHCGISVRLPEQFEPPLPKVILTSRDPLLAHVLQDVARWEYHCDDCLTDVTVYVESAERRGGSEGDKGRPDDGQAD